MFIPFPSVTWPFSLPQVSPFYCSHPLSPPSYSTQIKFDSFILIFTSLILIHLLLLPYYVPIDFIGRSFMNLLHTLSLSSLLIFPLLHFIIESTQNYYKNNIDIKLLKNSITQMKQFIFIYKFI